MKAPPVGVLPIACTLESDNTYNMHPNESAPTILLPLGLEEVCLFIGKSVVHNLLDKQESCPFLPQDK